MRGRGWWWGSPPVSVGDKTATNANDGRRRGMVSRSIFPSAWRQPDRVKPASRIVRKNADLFKFTIMPPYVEARGGKDPGLSRPETPHYLKRRHQRRSAARKPASRNGSCRGRRSREAVMREVKVARGTARYGQRGGGRIGKVVATS